MKELIQAHFLIVFPVYFVALWLAIVTSLGFVSGWYRLMRRFPDRDEPALLELFGQSGSMGPGVRMRGILRLSACPSGLRVGLIRLFGPFSRDFLVPWEEIQVTRTTSFGWRLARLRFGDPTAGTLGIAPHVADRLARAAAGKWPEAAPFPPETPRAMGRRLLTQWAVATGLAASFFLLVPRALAPGGPHLPIPVAILFPAIVFGVVTIIRYQVERE